MLFQNIVESTLARKAEQKTETPTDIAREALEKELHTLVSQMLNASAPERVSAKRAQRAGEKIAEALANLSAERKKTQAISEDSDPVDVEALLALPEKLGAINALSEEKMKEHIKAIYGGVPRGRFARHSWGAKMFSDREHFKA